MLIAHTVAQVRAAEETLLRAESPTGDMPTPGSTSALMMRAATGLAARCVRVIRDRRGLIPGARAVVLAGGGDNGGDAAHAGALLARRGVQVHVVTVSDLAHREGIGAARSAGARIIELAHTESPDPESPDPGSPNSGSPDPGSLTGGGLPPALVAALDGADLLIDGILGIGASGGLREPVASLVRAITDLFAAMEFPPEVVAVDLPSGVDPNTGYVPGPVLSADVTVTFGTAKPCHLLPPAALHAGEVHVVDLGLDLPGPAVWRLEGDDVACAWPWPRVTDHKYTRGVVGLIGGSPHYAGAAALAAQASTRAGAGMVRVMCSEDAAALVRARTPEAVVGDGQVQAYVVGPGLDVAGPDRQPVPSPDQAAQALLSGQCCIVDAGGLALLPGTLESAGREANPWILTPHAGEAADLLTRLGEQRTRAEVEADPAGAASALARRCAAAVLLKGPVTVVATPGGTIWSQADATPWLATAGAGDVLAGILGAVVAELAARAEGAVSGVLSAETLGLAAAAAASVHGLAARSASTAVAGGPITASMVADQVPVVLGRLSRLA